MNFDFTNQVSSFLTYDSVAPKGFEFDSRSLGSFKIKYSLILELREYGVKGMTLIVPDQEVEGVLSLIDSTEETVEFNVKISLKDIEVSLPENYELGVLCPEEIEIELSKLDRLPDGSFAGEGSAVLEF